jgi:TPP-dependent trihydroxycyclohexane-1,2-dione (THcHDO) dehydratase
MTTTKKYNGWSNYETWNVALWMDNGEGSYDYWNERTTEICEAATDKADAITTLANALKDEHQENMPEVQDIYADLLQASLDSVYWYEIAENRVCDAISNDPDLFKAAERDAQSSK